MSLFANVLIICIENTVDSTKKLLELINKFSKVAGCKINIQKLAMFLYTNSQLFEKEIKKVTPFTIALKSVKYL